MCPGQRGRKEGWPGRSRECGPICREESEFKSAIKWPGQQGRKSSQYAVRDL